MDTFIHAYTSYILYIFRERDVYFKKMVHVITVARQSKMHRVVKQNRDPKKR